MILVNYQPDPQFFMYVYFYSLHVSGSHVPIMRKVSSLMVEYRINVSTRIVTFELLLNPYPGNVENMVSS